MRSTTVLFSCLALLALAGPVHASARPAAAVPPPEVQEEPFPLYRYSLPNGLAVWAQPRPESQSVAALLVIHAGSRYEDSTNNGVAHFVEHMVFTGTDRWTEEQLKQAEKQARELAAKRKKSKLRSQKGEVPPGAETAEIEGWEPFAWKNNGLRHSYISYRLAAVQNTAQVALEAGNSPQMIFQHYRELVRPADAEKWFAVTLASVEAARAEREAGKDAKIVKLPKQAVA